MKILTQEFKALLIGAKSKPSLDLEETKIITSCEDNEPICDGKDFLKTLKDLHIGNIYNNKIYIRKLYFGSPSLFSFEGSLSQLQRAYLEINNSCDRNCWFCGYNGIKSVSAGPNLTPRADPILTP